MKRFLLIFIGMAAALLLAEWIQGLVLTAVYIPGSGTVEWVMRVRLGISALCVTGVYLLVNRLDRKRGRA